MTIISLGVTASMAPRATSPRQKRNLRTATEEEMIQQMEISPEEIEMMKQMEQQLAEMKQKHGLSSASSVTSWSMVEESRRPRSSGGEEISSEELLDDPNRK